MKKKKSKVRVCDDLWAIKVKERAGWKCEVCGKTPTNNKGTILLQSHHVIPRTNYATRFRLENGVCLCYKDHIHYAHKDAMGFADWFRKHRPHDAALIEGLRYNQVKNNYEEIKEYLESL